MKTASVSMVMLTPKKESKRERKKNGNKCQLPYDLKTMYIYFYHTLIKR